MLIKLITTAFLLYLLSKSVGYLRTQLSAFVFGMIFGLIFLTLLIWATEISQLLNLGVDPFVLYNPEGLALLSLVLGLFGLVMLKILANVGTLNASTTKLVRRFAIERVQST